MFNNDDNLVNYLLYLPKRKHCIINTTCIQQDKNLQFFFFKMYYVYKIVITIMIRLTIKLT